MRVASSADAPCFVAKKAAPEGTYTVPAHKPAMDTSRYVAFKRVRLRYSGEKSIAMARLADSGGFHRFGSCTPLLISSTKKAGMPPMANIARQPNAAPT